MKAVVVIDGEHYPPVVRDALAALPYEVIGVWLAGGTEKLRGSDPPKSKNARLDEKIDALEEEMKRMRAQRLRLDRHQRKRD